MKNFLTIFFLSFLMVMTASDLYANHCSGGHKEIKDTKETTTDDSDEAKSN